MSDRRESESEVSQRIRSQTGRTAQCKWKTIGVQGSSNRPRAASAGQAENRSERRRWAYVRGWS